WRRNGVNLTDGPGITGAMTPTLTVSNIAVSAGICGTVLGTASGGAAFGNVIAGQTYTYQASGCVISTLPSAGVDPDGLRSSNACATLDVPGIVGIPNNPYPFWCPGLTNWSLVGKIGSTCIQLGKAGSFIAPASGTLTLYCNDQT